MRTPEKVKSVLRDLPDKPGCYIMRDRNGRIVYVGKALSLRKRVRSYFRDATLRAAPPKLRSLIHSVAALEFLVVRNEAEAILTEGRLIKDFKPRYNVALRDDKRFLLLRADPADPFPKLQAVRLRRDDGARYFGPYASSRAVRETLDFVERRFGLRKCAPRIPDQSTYKHCIDDIVRFCSAPCIGRAAPEEYRERFEEACAFLRGERPQTLRELRAEMERAAAETDFERAAAIRDTLFMLDRTVCQNARVVSTPEMERDAALAGIRGLAEALGLPRPPRTIEAFDVSNISGTLAVASMVCAVDGLPRRNRYRRFRIATVEGSDDPRMIAEVVRRRYGRLVRASAPMPDLVLLDGGITQLRAARAELEALGLSTLPSAGLAKRYEEVHYHDPGKPIRLPPDSDASKVLRRLRDEAHRFAITYHRLLRARRMRESVLDEIPGIGPTRKTALLKHFGSVRRLADAAEKDIAAAPGIGPEMARLIHAALRPAQHGAASDAKAGSPAAVSWRPL